MEKPLLEVANQTVDCLRYLKTTKEFKNQVIERLMPILEFLWWNKSFGMKFSTLVIKKFNILTGESTSYPNQKYCVNDVFELLLKSEDKKFLYFFKICIQVMCSRDFYRYIDSSYNCNELINDLNAIMEKNDVNFKIENGHFVNISKPTIKKAFEISYFG